MRNIRRDLRLNEEGDKQLPRCVTRARDVTGPVTRAPCAPGHVSCHALVSPSFPLFASFTRLSTASHPSKPTAVSLITFYSYSVSLDHRLRALRLLFPPLCDLIETEYETIDTTGIQAPP